MNFKAILFVSVASLIVCSGAIAKSKSRHSKARGYSYFVDGAKASQGECDGEGKIPRHLKRQKELARSKEYIGSESMESSGAEPSWKHYFTSKAACNDSLKRAGASSIAK